MESEFAIGIDLGTTNSCLGVWRNNKVEIIQNKDGKSTTQSQVAFTKDCMLVGQAAVNQAHRNSKNSVYGSKRLIGMKFDNPLIQKDLEKFPFEVQQGAGKKPMIKVQYKNEDKFFHAEQISAFILQNLVETAERYLNEDPQNIVHKVKKAVITVPAYFNDSQRQATIDAAKIAGLEVQRIISEPNAAAMAYGLTQKIDSQKNVLIFDLGGGTFDVSLLTLDNQLIDVKATNGNTHLGGEDFDNRLVDLCIDEFKNQTGEDIKGKHAPIRRLKNQCEKVKKLLSTMTEAVVNCDMLYNSEDFSLKITRAKFENICADLFQQCIDPITQVLKDGKLSKEQVDEVVLVGGSTYIPKIQSIIQEYFNGKELNRSINPDEAVAFGATVQSAVLLGQNEDDSNEILLVDAIPLSIGVETQGGIFEKIIERNSSKPIKKQKVFSTAVDNQKEVKVKIFEGERQLTKDNHHLGNFNLQIPPAPKGVPKIEVTITVDTDGVTHVTAYNQADDLKSEITILGDKGRLSQDEIAKMQADAEVFFDADLLARQKIEGQLRLKYTAQNMLAFVEKPEYSSKISLEQRNQITTIAQKAQAWLLDNKNANAELIKFQQQILDGFFKPIMEQMFQSKTQNEQNFDAELEAPQTNPGPACYGDTPDFLD